MEIVFTAKINPNDLSVSSAQIFVALMAAVAEEVEEVFHYSEDQWFDSQKGLSLGVQNSVPK